MKEKLAKLSDRLRQAMDEKGVRPIDLSEKTNIPKSMVSYYLSGRSVPKSDRLYTIAQTLGVSEAWLMGYDVPMTRTAEQKKNDAVVDVVAKLRKDSDFLEVVSLLADLPAEQYASVKTLLTGLSKK
jgi:transcriptional regulator with XRE-family HTH domain